MDAITTAIWRGRRMKYIAVLDTDEIEDFEFFEDGKEKYLHAVDANAENGEWIYLPFKPLEQEPILDKIRAEIEEQKQMECFDSYDEMFAYRTGLENAIDIIDKYKAEVEGT